MVVGTVNMKDQVLIAARDLARWQQLVDSRLETGWRIIPESLRVSTSCAKSDSYGISSDAFVAVMEKEMVDSI